MRCPGRPVAFLAYLDFERGLNKAMVKLAPDASPMVLRNTSSQQVYALTLGAHRTQPCASPSR